MKKHDLLGIMLAGCTGFTLLIAIIIKNFFPRIILPKFDSIAVIALSLFALLIDYYFCGCSRRDFRLIPLYSALIFGLFPFASGFTSPIEALILSAIGAVLFTLITYLFDSMTDRLSSGPAEKIAPLISAFGLFLASQCLMGII